MDNVKHKSGLGRNSVRREGGLCDLHHVLEFDACEFPNYLRSLIRSIRACKDGGDTSCKCGNRAALIELDECGFVMLMLGISASAKNVHNVLCMRGMRRISHFVTASNNQ